MVESLSIFCWICSFWDPNGNPLKKIPNTLNGLLHCMPKTLVNCFFELYCIRICFLGDERAFIISRVLVSRSLQGHNRMEIPPPGKDTSVGNGTRVYVKFCDNEVLPIYVIYFKCDNIQSRTFARLSLRPAITTTIVSTSHRPTPRPSSSYLAVETRTTHYPSQTPHHPVSRRVQPTPPPSSAFNCVIL